MGTLSEEKLAAVIVAAVAAYIEAEEQGPAPPHGTAGGETIKGQKAAG